jgi:hypothetical protein
MIARAGPVLQAPAGRCELQRPAGSPFQVCQIRLIRVHDDRQLGLCVSAELTLEKPTSSSHQGAEITCGVSRSDIGWPHWTFTSWRLGIIYSGGTVLQREHGLDYSGSTVAPSHHRLDLEVTAGETWPRWSACF